LSAQTGTAREVPEEGMRIDDVLHSFHGRLSSESP
jgi:hypothetical protein